MKSVLSIAVAVLLMGAVMAPALAQPLAWEQVGGEVFINGLAFDEADTLWAIGSRDLRHLPPGADTWTVINPDVYGNHLAFTDAGSLVVASPGVGRSTDRGRTFEDMLQRAGGGLYAVLSGPLAGRLFVGTRLGGEPHGAAFSADDGVTWTEAPIVPAVLSGTAFAFAAVPDGPNAGRVVAAGEGGLAYTDDGGLSWEPWALWQWPGYLGYSVIRLPSGPHAGRLLAAVDGAAAAVWGSDDDGATWAMLADLGVSFAGGRLVWAGATAAGASTVYAVGNRSDVWRSGDGGETWEALGNVNPEVTASVDDAVLGPDGRLYVTQKQTGPSEPTDGLWRTVAPVTVAAEGAPAEESGALGLSVYPNPASGGATAVLKLDVASEVRVAVFDVAGREVAVLHDGSLASGIQRFTLNASTLSAGVYVVRATGGGGDVAQRFTKLR